MSNSKNQQPIVLSLHNRGNVDYPRYMISDQYLRYWTGNGWSKQEDEDAAMVYAESNVALEEMHQLMMLDHGKRPKYRFCAPLYIDLYVDNEVSKRKLQSWLVKVTKLIMDTTKHGNGPLAGSYGTCRIEYGEMKECE
jgi:hypothetical protein